MKRVIKDYTTASDELMILLAEKFPDGIDPNKDLTYVNTIKGERIRVVEIATEDTLYMVKFSAKLEEAINDIDLDDLDDDEDDDDDGIMDQGSDDALSEAEEIADGDY